MPYFIAVYDWSLYTLPSAIPIANIEGDTHSNHPDSPDYNPYAPTWIGKTFTFDGGSSTQIEITDDDGQFEDGYVETGGAQTLTQAITINGTTYLAGSVIENELSMLDASGNEVFVVRIDGVNIGFSYPAGQEPTNGTTFTGEVGRDGDPFDSSDGASSSAEPYTNIVCFAEGTLILTPEGERPVESLRPGDLIITHDRGAQPVRWTRKDMRALEDVADDGKPVQIKADSLGAGVPARDLIVSPQHRIFVGGLGQLDQPFAAEAFAPAKSLTAVPGIRHMKGKKKITWIHFACDRHELVFANGCWSESLLLGAMAVDGMHAAQREALTDIFGVAPTPGAALNGPPARDCLTVGAARRQLAKHVKEKGRFVAQKIREWDVDLAMEQFEAERIPRAMPVDRALRKQARVA
ncbi:MAG: Hint domain-containing protein [Paracoccaceae bacterium]